MKKNIILGLIISLCSILLFILLSELTLRLLGIGYGNSPMEPHPILHHVHPQHYRFRFHMPSGESAGHDVLYDEQGISIDPDSDKRKCIDKSQTTHKMALMGDSFVEAKQVPFIDSFPGILDKYSLTDTCITNFGVSSYSPVIHRLQWQESIEQFNPTHVLLMLYSNDVRDDAKYTHQATLNENGAIIAIPGPTPSLLTTLVRKSYLARLIRKAQLKWQWTIEHNDNKTQKYDQTENAAVGGFLEENPIFSIETQNNVENIYKTITRSGAQFVLTAVPSRYELRGGKFQVREQFSRRVQEWSHNKQIPFLDLVGPFEKAHADGKKLFFDSDIHFNTVGHAIVAKAISERFPKLFQTPPA